MPGMYKYSMEIESNVKKLLLDTKELQDRMDTLEGKEYKINLNIDEKKLGNVISNLEKMLDSLGKGTGDFKQFENLSKELSSIVSEVQSSSKAFGKVDDSGTKTLLSSIQNIDKSLSELSQNILNVNKNMSNMGGNTSGAVKQVENISDAYQNAAKEAEKLADAQSKIGQKTNISLGDSKEQSTEIDLYHNLEKRKVTYDEIIDKIQTIISLKEKEKSLSKTSDDTKLYQKLYDENDINWAGDTEGTINRISDRLKEIYIKYNGKISLINENDIQEAAYLLDILKGAGESPNLNKSQEKFYQNKKFSNDSLFDNIHVDSQKTGEIDKINTELSETYRWFNQLEGVSLNENIANEIKSLISDMQISGKNANEYANDLLKIFNIEVGSNSVVEQQNKLQSELKETESQAEKTTMAVKEVSSTASTEQKKDAFPDKDISASVDSATNSIKEENNVLEQNTQKVKENTQAKEQNANVNFNKYDKRLDSYNGKIGKYKTTIDRFNNGGWTSDKYLKNVQAVKDAVKEYKTLLNELKGKDASLVTSDDINRLDNYEKKIKDTIATVTNMSAAEKGYNFVSGQKELDKIHKLLNENSKMSSEAKAKIRAYYTEIESGNPSMSLDRIHGEIMKIYNAEVEAGRAGRSFFDTLKNSGFHKLVAQMSGMFGFYDVINIGKQAISTIVSLDDALLDLKKTTSMSSTELNNFYYSANDVAKQMGVTTKSIIEQASDWSRLGYSSNEQATEMAKLSSKFASISPGMDTDQAQEGMVSIMKAWQINPEDVEKEILDPINQLGNKFAESNNDIVEGMKRSAAALAAVGTDYKDAYSLFTGVQEVLQNSEVAGRALRSISMRIRGYDENSEDGFEQTDDELKNITGDLIDLTKTAQHAQGVSIFKEGSTTEFKSLVDYFGEIHDIWDEMSQKQQNDFLQKAFGKTQAQAGAALIQNYDAVKEALAEIDVSAGSADKEMSTVEQTLSYKINALKETWVGCAQQILDRGDLGIAISGLNGVSKVITGLIDNVGLLKTVAMGVAAILSFKNVGGNKMHFPMNILDNIHNLLWIQRFRVCYP